LRGGQLLWARPNMPMREVQLASGEEVVEQQQYDESVGCEKHDSLYKTPIGPEMLGILRFAEDCFCVGCHTGGTLLINAVFRFARQS